MISEIKDIIKIVENPSNIPMLQECYKIATTGPDISTNVGAIIADDQHNILGTGCNHIPHGVAITQERLLAPLKYDMIEHAERASIYNTYNSGNIVKGSTMYATFYACTGCARPIIMCGIKRVIGDYAMLNYCPEKWKHTVILGMQMLCEAGIELLVDASNFEADEILIAGKKCNRKLFL